VSPEQKTRPENWFDKINFKYLFVISIILSILNAEYYDNRWKYEKTREIFAESDLMYIFCTPKKISGWHDIETVSICIDFYLYM